MIKTMSFILDVSGQAAKLLDQLSKILGTTTHPNIGCFPAGTESRTLS
jgi:hypothetical protein